MSPSTNRQPSVQKRVDARWVRWRSAAYLRGRGLSIFVGGDPLFPAPATDTGKYSLSVDAQRHEGIDLCDTKLDIIARDSCEHVFVGPKLATTPQAPTLLQGFVEKLQIGGHLILHFVDEHYTVEHVREMVGAFAQWQEKAAIDRDGQRLCIFKLLNRSHTGVLPQRSRALKRACICRYGAIGDMIMITPLIRRLHEDGYEVTLNITPYCADVIKHNPYITNIVYQERDVIPNKDLGDYWREWIGDYDVYINLSESIEGALLKVEGRRDFYTSQCWRTAQCGDVNYYDQTMRLGGYPECTGTRGELYFSRTEEKQAQWVRNKLKGKFFVLWGLRGSSHHKLYPLLQPTLEHWLTRHPEARVMLTGSARDAELQFPHPQIMGTAGQMPIRDVFALTQVADLVVGPESALINAAACSDVEKIVLLSHSSETNLCKYWRNYVALAPQNVACYPCHQLHYTQESCPLITIKDEHSDTALWRGPACAGGGVTPERLIAALDAALLRWQLSSAAV